MRYHFEPPRNWGRNNTVAEVFGRAAEFARDQLFGIEFEMEGPGMQPPIANSMRDWSGHSDGSLRGSSAEFVSRRPQRLADVRRALELLEERLSDNGAVSRPTNRTSTHVHLNFLHSSLIQVGNFAMLWYLLEDFLAEYSGPERVGNVFCLRLQDASSLMDDLIDTLQEGHLRPNSRSLRYAALNFQALGKFGTLEVRTYRGVERPTEIMPWLEALAEMHRVAHELASPQSIVVSFSEMGPLEFVQQHLPTTYNMLRNLITERGLYEAVRRCQPLAYAIQWDMVNETGNISQLARPRNSRNTSGLNPVEVRSSRLDHVILTDIEDL